MNNRNHKQAVNLHRRSMSIYQIVDMVIGALAVQRTDCDSALQVFRKLLVIETKSKREFIRLAACHLCIINASGPTTLSAYSRTLKKSVSRAWVLLEELPVVQNPHWLAGMKHALIIQSKPYETALVLADANKLTSGKFLKHYIDNPEVEGHNPQPIGYYTDGAGKDQDLRVPWFGLPVVLEDADVAAPVQPSAFESIVVACKNTIAFATSDGQVYENGQAIGCGSPSISPLSTIQGLGRNADHSIKRPYVIEDGKTVDLGSDTPGEEIDTVVNPITEHVLDGVVYQMRPLTAADLSIKHHADPEVARNDGWKQPIVDGRPWHWLCRIKP